MRTVKYPLMTSAGQFGSPQKGPPLVGGERSVQSNRSVILRYGLAVVSVALALLATLVLQHYRFRGVVLSLFLFAIALTVWYADVGPAILAIVLSILCFIYFFSPPIYSLAFSVADVPAILILLSFAVLIVRFSAVRRRVEGQILRARDELLADIDERKKAEEKLQRSEAYLAEAERLSKTASWAWSPVTQQSLYWSEEMFRIFGFDPQQGLPPAETFWERVHREDRDDMIKLMRVAIQEKREYVHEHRIVMPDGTVKHIHAVGHPLLDAAGGIVEYVGTLADVTERKQAEQARQELEEQWRAAYECNPTMYFIIDAAGEIVSVNTFGAEQLGYSVGELIGQPVLSVFYQRTRSECCSATRQEVFRAARPDDEVGGEENP